MGKDGRKIFARGGRGADVLPGLHWCINGMRDLGVRPLHVLVAMLLHCVDVQVNSLYKLALRMWVGEKQLELERMTRCVDGSPLFSVTHLD